MWQANFQHLITTIMLDFICFVYSMLYAMATLHIRLQKENSKANMSTSKIGVCPIATQTICDRMCGGGKNSSIHTLFAPNFLSSSIIELNLIFNCIDTLWIVCVCNWWRLRAALAIKEDKNERKTRRAGIRNVTETKNWDRRQKNFYSIEKYNGTRKMKSSKQQQKM